MGSIHVLSTVHDRGIRQDTGGVQLQHSMLFAKPTQAVSTVSFGTAHRSCDVCILKLLGNIGFPRAFTLCKRGERCLQYQQQI